MKFKAVVFVLLFLIICLAIIYGKTRYARTNVKLSPPVIPNFCDKETPYNIAPEFERAVSLIIQRYDNGTNQTLAAGIKQMRNCLDIKYDKSITESEGYFIFDYSNANLNYFPIYASDKYHQLDDISIALLLDHEIVHAIQFINSILQNEKLSCYQKEAHAFQEQYIFTANLNQEEKKSLVARMRDSIYWQNNTNPQIQMAKDLIDQSYTAMQYCNTNTYNECWREKFLQILEKSVKDNSYYQKQCANS